MHETAKTAQDMIAGMAPTLRSGRFMFVTTSDPDMIDACVAAAISTFREDEGMSMLLPVEIAQKAGHPCEQPMRCITLNVYSALEGTGLTAAVSRALADNNIPCNMIAAFHHDHVFVPEAMCDAAMKVLMALQQQAQPSA